MSSSFVDDDGVTRLRGRFVGSALPAGWTQADDGTVVAVEPGPGGNEYFRVIPDGADMPGGSEVFARNLRIYFIGVVDDADFIAKDSNGDTYFQLATGSPGEVRVSRIVGPDTSEMPISAGTAGSVSLVSHSAIRAVIVSDDGVFASLPVADPLLANALWNDSGTVKVSAGPPP